MRSSLFQDKLDSYNVFVNCSMRYIFTLVFFLLIRYGHSQPADLFYKNKLIKSFSSEQGLLHPDVSSIAQDKDGFLWIGTEIGLQRYDGYNFQNYFYDIGIKRSVQNSIVKDLLVDTTGNIWVATWGDGISIFNPESNGFSDFDLNKQAEPNNFHSSIQCLNQNKEGSFWIGTYVGLIFYSSPGKQADLYLNHPNDSTSISNNWVKQILECSTGNYLFICDDGLMNIFRPGHKDFKRVRINAGSTYRNNPIYFVCEYSRQYLLLGTSKGIYLYDTGSGSCTPLKSSNENKLQNSQIIGLYKQLNGKIWVATLNDGLFEIDLGINARDEVYIENVNGVLANIVVNDIFTDEQGNVWIATLNSGLKVIVNKELSIASIDFVTEPVYCIAKEGTNYLWIGTIGGGLYKYNLLTHSHKQYNVSSGLSSNYIRFIYVEGSEKMLIGTSNGLNVLDLKSEKISVLSDEDGILNSEIVFINKDKKGNYWMGSVTNGLVHLDVEHNKVEAFVPKNDEQHASLGNTNVRSALFDRQGRLWVGVYGGGLNLFDTEKKIFTKRYLNRPDDELSLKDNFVLDLSIDSDDQIWVGTLGGFHQFVPDSETFINYPIKGGLTASSVQAIIEDNQDNIWVSTFSGLKRFDKKTQTYKEFDQSDGLLNKVFVNGSKFKDKNGDLYFGSWDRKKNIIAVNPEALSFNKYEPQLKLVDFKIYNKPVEIGIKGSPMQKHISKTKSITLKHDQTAITIEYVALNFISPENNKYAFRMEGLESEWREVGNQRIANYSNIPPGEYTFMVKASNNDDIWTKEPLALQIKVLPHPLKSNLAYTLYWILFLMANIFVIWFVRWNVKRNHDMKLAQMDSDKEKQLTHFKLQFFTNISHELRTHLTLIVSPITKLVKKGSHSGEDKILLHQIDLNVSRLLKLTDEIIDFRRVEQGKIKLEMQRANIVGFIYDIYQQFKSVAEENGIRFEFHAGLPEIIWCFDEEKLKKILFNLLTNAFKYTPNEGQIKLSVIRINDEKLRIGVQDNGIGIEQEHLPQIFDRFFNPGKDLQLHGLHESSGIGLALSKQLVELHGGQIHVESEQGKGSHFFFDLQKQDCTDLETPLTETKVKFKKHEKWEEILQLERNNVLNELVLKNEFKPDGIPVVLIVDDNKEICLALNELLKNKYKIQVAGDGKKALEITEKENIDIIVSDVMMPVMDGIELCNQLKSNLKTSHIPVVLLTAKTGIDNELQGLRTGADAYITKPFNDEKVLLTIGNILDNRKKIQLFFKGDQQEKGIEPIINPLDKKLIDKVLRLIHEKISDTGFSVDELGQEAGLSRMHLFRKVKALTGESPSDLIKKVRLEKSKELLEQGELSISNIAYDTGFSTPGNFSTAFKKYFGDTPAQYREKYFSGNSNQF